MHMMHLRVLCLAALAGCTGDLIGGVAQPDPFDELEQIQRDGPPRYTSRIHGCAKMRYQTLGNLLSSRGVDLAATDELSAGRLYATGGLALGAANYAARVRDFFVDGPATTAKIFDI